MLKVSISPNTIKATSDFDRMLNQAVRSIAKDLLTTVKRYTPKRSGRARSNWRLRKRSNTNYNLRNNVPYIQRLDEGYSKQSPRGFYRPASREVSNRQRGKIVR